MAKTDIIIVSYNSWREIKTLLPTIEEHTKDFEITIVDNNSREATKKYLKTLPCRVIHNEKNVGYAAAINIGVAATSAPYIVFLNPDCKVTENWLEPMLKTLGQPKVAATGPTLFDDENRRYIEAPTSIPMSLRVDGELNWVCGAVFALKRSTYKSIGRFDERFFFMWEETEWCQRAVDKGWRVVCTYDSTVTHDGGKSTRLDEPLWKKHYHKGRKLFYELHPTKKKTVLVATPSYGRAHPLFFVNILNTMSGLFKRQYTENQYEFLFGSVYGHAVQDSRNKIVEMAQGAGCDYIWFIDNDMIVGPDTFDKLISHDREIVSTLCFRRGEPFDPMMFKITKKSRKGYYYKTLEKIPDERLVEVDAIGGGSFLVKTSVFDNIPTPYFWIKPHMGEDIWFSQRLMNAGIKMYVDTEAEAGHIGDLVIARNTFEDWQRMTAPHEMEA